MSIQVFGLPVSRGVAIGRAVLVASSRVDVAHYYVEAGMIEAEVQRLRAARDLVVEELTALKGDVPEDAHDELVRAARRAPDAAAGRFPVRGHAAMDRRAPLQRRMGAVVAAGGDRPPVRRDGGRVPARPQGRPRAGGRARHHRARTAGRRLVRRSAAPQGQRDFAGEDPLVLVANDIAPADMLKFRRSVFTGFVTDVGGRNSHTAIVARSMDIPAVVGAREASRIVTPGRLDHHRRRRRRRDRQPLSHRARGIPLPPTPGRTRTSAARSPAPHAGGHAGRPPDRAAAPTSSCRATRRPCWTPARWASACSAASSCS